MKPVFQIVTSDGEDVTSVLEDRVLSIEITDEAGIVADSFRMELDDRDGAVAMPGSNVTLQVWLGYAGQTLLDMGTYTVDEVELNDSARSMSISGKSANMVATLKSWKKRSWDKKLNPSGTLGGIIRTVAKEHKLEPAIAKEFESIKIDHLDQTYESDMNMLTRLAEQYGAVCKPAGGRLLFVKRGAGQAADGSPLPTVTLVRSVDDLTNVRVSYNERASYARVGAHWHSKGKAKVQYVYAGEGEPVMFVRHPYKTERDALAAADAKLRKLKRGRTSLTLDCVGRPELCAEMPIEVLGVRDGVDGAWICTRATHRYTGNGLTTSLEAQRPDDFEPDPSNDPGAGQKTSAADGYKEPATTPNA